MARREGHGLPGSESGGQLGAGCEREKQPDVAALHQWAALVRHEKNRWRLVSTAPRDRIPHVLSAPPGLG